MLRRPSFCRLGCLTLHPRDIVPPLASQAKAAWVPQVTVSCSLCSHCVMSESRHPPSAQAAQALRGAGACWARWQAGCGAGAALRTPSGWRVSPGTTCARLPRPPRASQGASWPSSWPACRCCSPSPSTTARCYRCISCHAANGSLPSTCKRRPRLRQGAQGSRWPSLVGSVHVLRALPAWNAPASACGRILQHDAGGPRHTQSPINW